jgi:hypothetical protein
LLIYLDRNRCARYPKVMQTKAFVLLSLFFINATFAAGSQRRPNLDAYLGGYVFEGSNEVSSLFFKDEIEVTDLIGNVAKYTRYALASSDRDILNSRPNRGWHNQIQILVSEQGEILAPGSRTNSTVFFLVDGKDFMPQYVSPESPTNTCGMKRFRVSSNTLSVGICTDDTPYVTLKFESDGSLTKTVRDRTASLLPIWSSYVTRFFRKK